MAAAADIMVTEGAQTPFSSIGRLGAARDGESVFKLFSSRPLKEGELEDIFEEGHEVLIVKEWRAYPRWGGRQHAKHGDAWHARCAAPFCCCSIAVLCCAVLCCAVLCCAVLCCEAIRAWYLRRERSFSRCTDAAGAVHPQTTGMRDAACTGYTRTAKSMVALPAGAWQAAPGGEGGAAATPSPRGC